MIIARVASGKARSDASWAESSDARLDTNDVDMTNVARPSLHFQHTALGMSSASGLSSLESTPPNDLEAGRAQPVAREDKDGVVV